MNTSPKIAQMLAALETLALAQRLQRAGMLHVGEDQLDAWSDELKIVSRAAFREAMEIRQSQMEHAIEQSRLHLTETLGFPVELTESGVQAYVEGLGMVPLDEVLGDTVPSEPMLPLSKVIAIIESEPELPGPMPRGVWITTWKFIARKGLVTLLRRTVRVTKNCIVKRVYASVGREAQK